MYFVNRLQSLGSNEETPRLIAIAAAFNLITPS